MAQILQLAVKLGTCPDEHDIILPVLRLHSVHHQLGELVVHVRPHHDGTPAYWVHWVVHGWVTPGKGDDIIREVLGGVESAECLTGTLRVNSEKITNHLTVVCFLCANCKSLCISGVLLMWRLTVPGRG